MHQLSRFKIFLLLFLTVFLGVSIYAVTQSTEFRQRASEGAILYMTAVPRTASPGQKVTLSLDVETQTIPVTIVRVNLTYPQDKLQLEKTDFGGSAFDMPLGNLQGNGYIQLSRDTTRPVNGKSHVATIHFVAKDTVNMDDIQPVNGTAIVSTDKKNIYADAVSREGNASEPSIFSVSFFFQLFQGIFR